MGLHGIGALLTLGRPGAQGGASELVVTEFTQTFGAELVLNGDMETGDPPDSWIPRNNGVLSSVADERTGGAGSAAINMARAGSSYPGAYQTLNAAPGWYEASVWIRAVELPCSFVVRETLSNDLFLQVTTTQQAWIPYMRLFRSSHSTLTPIVNGGAGGVDGDSARADDVSIKQITTNQEHNAPSADMRLDMYYNLPGAPINGTALALLSRIEDFAAGNYWLALLEYTGSRWDVTLYSVADHARTSRITVVNVGVTDGLRVEMDADSISLYTTADAGDNWTQRGSTISNSAYQTATGVNTIYTSDVTPTKLVCAPI